MTSTGSTSKRGWKKKSLACRKIQKKGDVDELRRKREREGEGRLKIRGRIGEGQAWNPEQRIRGHFR
jgi:hypothetical protein